MAKDLHPLAVHMPAVVTQQSCRSAIAIAAIPPGKRDDVLG